MQLTTHLQLQKNQASDECALEPIRTPGGIQSFGALLVCNAENVVQQCSRNAVEFLSREVIGAPLVELFSEHLGSKIINSFRKPVQGVSKPISTDANLTGLSILAHSWNKLGLIEIIPHEKSTKTDSDLHELVRLQSNTQSVEEYSHAVCEHFRQVTGYDRVLVYRFNSNWSGQVIAESFANGQNPFFGLNYPASDIPAQARALYHTMRVRVLADAAAEPVPLTPTLTPSNGLPLDLSYSVLRALSPMHRKYLLSMGARASLVCSIIIEGKLWGFINCLHRSPKIPLYEWNIEADTVARLLANMISLSEFREKDAGISSAKHSVRLSLETDIEDEEKLTKRLVSEEFRLLEILAADGICCVQKQFQMSRGSVPTRTFIQQLAEWLKTYEHDIFATDRLGELVPSLPGVSEAAGVLAIKIRSDSNSWLIWFRKEQEQRTEWAGQPDAVYRTFDKWVETIRGRAIPWNSTQLAMASSVIQPTLFNATANACQRQVELLQSYQHILFEQVHDSVIVTDIEGKILYLNDLSARMIGWGNDELVGTFLLNWVHSDDQQAAVSAFAEVKEGNTFSGRLRVVHRCGHSIWLDMRLRQLHALPGHSLGILAASRDVSAEKIAEDQLRLQQAIVHNVRDSIFVTEAIPLENQGPRIIYANPAFLQMTGYRLEEVIGQTPHILRGPKTNPETLNHIRHALREGKPARVEWLNYRKDGSEFWAELFISPLTDETGSVGNFIAMQRDITERKEAEATLQAERSFLRNVIDAVPAFISVKDAQDRFTLVNQPLAMALGSTPEGLIGKAENDFTSRFSIPTEMKPDQSVLSFETEMQTQNLGLRWLSTEKRELSMLDHKAESQLLTVSTDITDKRNSQIELRESEEQLRLALDAARMGTFDWIIPEHRVTWSRWHEELWGYKPGEFTGIYESVFDRVHPEDRKQIESEILKCMSDQTRFALEFRVVWPDESIHWIYSVGEFEFDDSGRAFRLRGVVREITQRKRVEQLVAESEARLRNILDRLHFVVAFMTPDAVIVEANRSFLELVNLPRDHVIGVAFHKLIGREHQLTDQDHLWDLVTKASKGESLNCDLEVSQSTHTCTLDSVFAPLLNSSGEVTAVVFSAVDISEQVVIHRALRSSHERLAALSRQLISAQETERRRIARELHDEFGQLLTAVHVRLAQLRSNCTESLLPKLDEIAQIVDSAILQVRTMSLNLRPAILDDFGLVAALRWLVERQQRPECLISVQIKSCGVQIPTELSNACYRVVQEALTNVLRHSNASRVFVDLNHEPMCLSISIKDNGKGCDFKDILDRASLGLHFGILGMQERAELLGGTFRFTSTPGEGTTIEVVWPLSNASSREDEQLSDNKDY